LLQLPGEGTTDVGNAVAVVGNVDPQAISIKAANADPPARSIFLYATKIVPAIKHSRLSVYQVIQQS
jgi:hypothetical protein